LLTEIIFFDLVLCVTCHLTRSVRPPLARDTKLMCDSHASVHALSGRTYARHVSQRLLMSCTQNEKRIHMRTSRKPRIKILFAFTVA